jgi:hypothetical protein
MPVVTRFFQRISPAPLSEDRLPSEDESDHAFSEMDGRSGGSAIPPRNQ